MSLDTKHAEIAKMEQRAAQREEALMVRACAPGAVRGSRPPAGLPRCTSTTAACLPGLCPGRRRARLRWTRTRSGLRST